MSDRKRVNASRLDWTRSARTDWLSNTLQEMRPYVGENSKVCDELHDGKPDANVLRSLHHRATVLSHKLLRVESDLHPVVNKSKKRRQRACRHKDGDEAKLDHCWWT